MFGGKGKQPEVGEEEKTPDGGSAASFNDEIINVTENGVKHSKNSALKIQKTTTKTASIKTASKFQKTGQNIDLKNDTKFKKAFYIEAARSRISSISSNDEGISKTPKNTNKNFQIPINYQEKVTSDSVSSVESALTSQHPLQSDFQRNSSFEKAAFQKRLFKNIVNNSNLPIKSYDHWMTIQINDLVLVEMNYESLQKGRETFNDFLDTCYDDDSVSKLVVYFSKCSSLKTTFFTMDFGVLSSVKVSKMVGEQVLAENCYMVMECSISTSDEDFSEDDADLIEFD